MYDIMLRDFVVEMNRRRFLGLIELFSASIENLFMLLTDCCLQGMSSWHAETRSTTLEF